MAISRPWRNVISTGPSSTVALMISPVEIAARIRALDGELIGIQGEAEAIQERFTAATDERRRLQTQLLTFLKEHMQGWRIKAEYIEEGDRDAQG